MSMTDDRVTLTEYRGHMIKITCEGRCSGEAYRKMMTEQRATIDSKLDGAQQQGVA